MLTLWRVVGWENDMTTTQAFQEFVVSGETQENNRNEENNQYDFACGQEERKGTSGY